MLKIFTGSDTMRQKVEAQKLAQGYEMVKFGEGGEPFENVMGYLSQRGMFQSKVALFLDRPFDDAVAKESLIESLEVLQKADALVLIIQPDIHAATLKKIGKHADVLYFDAPQASEEPGPSVFALTDAFAEGKRKDSWILYRRLIESGTAVEEIHGALAWQARALVLASKTKSAIESGLKPFVYSKAKRAAARFKEGEADQLSRDLMHMVHQSRLGQGPLEELLEAYLLKK